MWLPIVLPVPFFPNLLQAGEETDNEVYQISDKLDDPWLSDFCSKAPKGSNS